MNFSNFSRRKMLYPQEGVLPQIMPEAPAIVANCQCPDAGRLIALYNRMRMVWSQHVWWTRMLIISIAHRLPDQQATTARLLENPEDFAKILEDYFPTESVDAVKQLITEHLQIAAALVTTLRDGEMIKAAELNKEWYQNADSIAQAFAGISPQLNCEEVRRMFYNHLDLTKQEAAMRLAGNYPADIAAMNAAEQEMLAMADMFTEAIIRLFPEKFCKTGHPG